MRKVLYGAIISVFFLACNNEQAKTTPAAGSDSSGAATETKKAPAEFADAKYVEFGKKSIAGLSSGDIDAWTASYADNAVYVWNNGDSIAGKTAINEYWKKRRTEVIDSITFANDIWLPVKINQPQSVEAPGTWLLGWYQVHAKYKTGKSMTQWIHVDMHFNSVLFNKALFYCLIFTVCKK
jgi:hypothetical protein